MKEEITEQAIRGNAFKEGGVFVANSILTNPNLTPLEKLIYAHVSALNQNKAGCFQSTAYIAAKLGCSAPSVKRSIYRLIKLGMFKRVQKGLNGKMRQLWCCDYVSDEAVNGYKLDQNDPAEDQNDPREDQNDPTDRIKMIQKEDQNDPDIIPSYNTNIIYKTNTKKSENKDPTPHSENTPAVISEATSTQRKKEEPSKKVARKKVPSITAGDPEVLDADELLGDPRPDPSDRSLKVRMPQRDWDKFISQVGEECAFYWCQQLEDYAGVQPKKFQAYTSHYRTLLKWHQMRCADGLVFGWTPQGGNGFYKHWVNGLKVGGRNG